MNVTVIVRFLTNIAEMTRAALRMSVRFIVLFYEKREELIILLFVAIMVWLAVLLYGLDANAQSKFFSTPNRAGAEGAKGNAMLHTLLQENVERRNETTANAASITALRDATEASLTTITNCGAQGMIFGRGHVTANSNDCIPSLQVANDGRVSLQGGMKFGDYVPCDPTTAGTMRYNAAAKRMEFCNGSIWGMLGGHMGCSINFPAVTNADLDTYYDTTDAIYSAETATASVAGATPATIRRNGANTGMSSGVIVNQGNSVGIRGRSAALFNQTANFTLDIGAYTACWQITTKQQDVTPNAFSFNDVTDQELSTLVLSNSVTVSGFDGPLTVSVSGQGNPQLKIGSGGWTTSGEINPGQTLTLRMTTSSNYVTAFVATVILGSSEVDWSVTTKSSITCTSLGQSAGGGVCMSTGVNALIVATSDDALEVIWSNAFHSTGATSTTNGYANTQTIISNAASHPAAAACGTSTRSGYTDWYLPARSELNTVYQNHGLMGGFSVTHRYWTSTEYDSSTAWFQHFGDGHQNAHTKNDGSYFRARCVRRG